MEEINVGCRREWSSNTALGLLQTCPCPLYEALHSWCSTHCQPFSCFWQLLWDSSGAHLWGLILPCRAAAQGWGKRRARFPDTIPTLVNKVQGREQKKNHRNKTLLAAAESSDSSHRQPPLLHGMWASNNKPMRISKTSGSPPLGGKDSPRHIGKCELQTTLFQLSITFPSPQCYSSLGSILAATSLPVGLKQAVSIEPR